MPVNLLVQPALAYTELTNGEDELSSQEHLDE